MNVACAVLTHERKKIVHEKCEKLDSQQSTVCSISIVDKRTDVSGVVIKPMLMLSLKVARVDWEASSRDNGRIRHSIVKFEVLFDVVVVDMRDEEC